MFAGYSEIRRRRHGGNGRAQPPCRAVEQDLVFVESPRGGGRGRARLVRASRESIHVFVDDEGTRRADHVLHVFGLRFLELHDRMPKRVAAG